VKSKLGIAGDAAGECRDRAGLAAPAEEQGLRGKAEQVRGKGGSWPAQGPELGLCSTCVTGTAFSHGHRAGKGGGCWPYNCFSMYHPPQSQTKQTQEAG